MGGCLISRSFPRDMGYHQCLTQSASDESKVRGKERWNAASREKRPQFPDFLYVAPSNGYACGFHRGKPHKVHQSRQLHRKSGVYTRLSRGNKNQPFGTRFVSRTLQTFPVAVTIPDSGSSAMLFGPEVRAAVLTISYRFSQNHFAS